MVCYPTRARQLTPAFLSCANEQNHASLVISLMLLNFALLQANKSGLDGEGAVITLSAPDNFYLNDDGIPSAS